MRSGGGELVPNQKNECLTVSVETAAKWLGISRGLAYSMVHQKKIPALRFNRCIRIPKFALEKLLAEAGNKTGGIPS
ncbi:MAG: DNA-binding protein [Dehalococcoidia bacterium]|nr:MAG: DNA-binding protein [Dehalococcoidia bacterium]